MHRQRLSQCPAFYGYLWLFYVCTALFCCVVLAMSDAKIRVLSGQRDLRNMSGSYMDSWSQSVGTRGGFCTAFIYHDQRFSHHSGVFAFQIVRQLRIYVRYILGEDVVSIHRHECIFILSGRLGGQGEGEAGCHTIVSFYMLRLSIADPKSRARRTEPM